MCLSLVNNSFKILKWEDTIKSITQVYLQQIREKKNTNNYKKQAKQSHAYYYQ